MAVNIIRQFLMKKLMKPDASGIMKIPEKGRIDFTEHFIKERLFTNGIDHRTIQNEKQLKNILDSIDQAEARKLKQGLDENVGTNIDGSKNYFYTQKEKPSGKIIEVDFDQGRWKDMDPEKKAGGGRTGLSYLLAEDTNERMPFFAGKVVTEIIKKVGKRKPKVKPKTEMDKIREWGVKEMEYTNPKSIYYDERRVLQDKYPGITDDLLNKILIDDNPQRKAEVLATIDEAFRMMEKGKGHKEIIQIFKSTPRTKQAEGGRIGFGLGGFNAARRAFLKAMGAGAAGVGAAKSGLFGLLKSSKPVAKELTQVPIKNVDGMPSWFKPLVNRVIKEGEEVSGDLERIITHKTKLPESKTDVYVTQDLNTGDVVVDIGMSKHGWADGKFGQPVRLEYKASEVIPLHSPDGSYSKVKHGNKTHTKTPEEFNVEEAGFTGGHPENIKFEDSTIEKFGDHASDFSEVEKFAIGKNTIKGQIGGKSKPLKKHKDEYKLQKEEGYFDEAEKDFYEGKASGGVAKMLGE